jgi:ribosome-associated protein
MKDVEITREPIELHKLLKFEGLATSGGEAKALIAAGKVSLNGLVETQKRKKIVSGDCIEIGDTKLTLRLIDTADKP